jgi:hypothetical protein
MNLHENCWVGRCITVSGYDKMHFRIIRFVRETLYELFVNPKGVTDELALRPTYSIIIKA